MTVIWASSLSECMVMCVHSFLSHFQSSSTTDLLWGLIFNGSSILTPHWMLVTMRLRKQQSLIKDVMYLRVLGSPVNHNCATPYGNKLNTKRYLKLMSGVAGARKGALWPKTSWGGPNNRTTMTNLIQLRTSRCWGVDRE